MLSSRPVTGLQTPGATGFRQGSLPFVMDLLAALCTGENGARKLSLGAVDGRADLRQVSCLIVPSKLPHRVIPAGN